MFPPWVAGGQLSGRDPAQPMLQQLKGPGGAFHVIPGAENWLAWVLLDSQNPKQEMLADLDRGSRKKLPGEAGVCAQRRRTEQHSDKVGLVHSSKQTQPQNRTSGCE